VTGPFRPAELAGADEPLGPVEQAEALSTARELEAAAMAADVRPSPGFSARVMAAVATQPLPRPVAALIWAASRWRVRALVSAFADTWHLAWIGRRPLAARAQALAVVVMLIVAVGSVSGLAVAGVAGMLGKSMVTAPSPSAVPATAEPSSEEASPSPTPSAEPRVTPEPPQTPEPKVTPKRSAPRPTVHPTETPEDGDDHGGSDGSGSEDPSGRGE
jgi:hypothetical protein